MACTRYAPSTLAKSNSRRLATARQCENALSHGHCANGAQIVCHWAEIGYTDVYVSEEGLCGRTVTSVRLADPQSNELSGVYLSQVFTLFVGLRSSNQALIFNGGQQT